MRRILRNEIAKMSENFLMFLLEDDPVSALETIEKKEVDIRYFEHKNLNLLTMILSNVRGANSDIYHKIFVIVLEKGFDPDFVGKNGGGTALTMMRIREPFSSDIKIREKYIRTLIDYGANIYFQDYIGKTILDEMSFFEKLGVENYYLINGRKNKTSSKKEEMRNYYMEEIPI